MTKINMRLAGLLAASVVCVPSHAADPPPAFTLQNAFAGESEGNGTLKLFFGKPRRLHVSSHGTMQPNGTFRLEQSVTFEGEAPRDRVWIISEAGPNSFSATLSDAAGPVTGQTSGPRLSLRYRARGPFFMQQELELMPDGKTIDNVGVITLLGIPVGRLQETIVRKDRGAGSGSSTNEPPLGGEAHVAHKAVAGGLR